LIKKRRLTQKDPVPIFHKNLIPFPGPKCTAEREAKSRRLCGAQNKLRIKAKTNEGLGLIGRERAIACWAVVSVEEKAGKKA
jgi:2C-methyl-D-erythritol 2,4-cyclodiphosphate synthase